jgi:alpha-1,3-rhamnosyl/mannosyltransferase
MATVATIQDLLAIEHPNLHRSGADGLVKRMYYGAAVWRALRRATRLITTTAAMADRIIQLCSSAHGRTVVIPLAPGADCQLPTDVSGLQRRVAALVGGRGPYCLVVGQNSRTKAHTVALEAFAAGAPPDWNLVLLQRQTTAHPLAHVARSLHVEQRVIWMPGVARADLVALLQGAGVLLQPSMYEGFGLPVVEAMACGCPVIASDIPTLREVAGPGAIFTPPGDVPRLASAIRALAESSAYRDEMSARGRARASAFSWERCARETLDVYAEASSARAGV